MCSDKSTVRRTPSQSRSEQRLQAIFLAAEAVFAERGFEGATMTEIAARSHSSIGALYQYYRNKEALGIALREHYADEMSARWNALAEQARDLPLDQLVHRIFHLMYAFFEEHPAYFVLLGAPLAYERNAEAREQLRNRFAQLFQARSPGLDRHEAVRVATVSLQIVKGLGPLYTLASAAERKHLGHEFEQALLAYVSSRLQ